MPARPSRPASATSAHAGSTPSAARQPGQAEAVRLLAFRGYEATTAEALADAVGMSRSTFFRRFGSKDDVIFADHDEALTNLQTFLAHTDLAPDQALIAGTCDVLRLLIRDPEAARLRFSLVRQHPQLKERELVITHRYERVYARFLRESLPASIPAWAHSSLAASFVAVHNQTLRAWLRGEVADAPAALDTQLRELAGLFRAKIAPTEGSASRVVVAVYDAGGSPDEVLAAVAAQLSA